jgi:hypothetical protein
MALAATRRIAGGLRCTGRFDVLAPPLAPADAQRLLALG